ncbi:RsmE family RNA methyltransferase [Rickettsiales bacterium]|nr:RsmE family RNA methyltransferase [Rickettsiales bacterium]
MQLRMYIEEQIEMSRPIALDDIQRHHLINVLRVKAGQEVICFDDKNEWLCLVEVVDKRMCVVSPKTLIRTKKEGGKEYALFFSIVKSNAIHDILSNAVQMGVTEINPVITRRSGISTINEGKCKKIIVGSACQCNTIGLPKFNQTLKLKEAINDVDFPILIANERISREDAEHDQFVAIENLKEKLKDKTKIGIIIGPEGGFCADELQDIRENKNVHEISLGENILRSEIATTVAMQLAKIILNG